LTQEDELTQEISDARAYLFRFALWQLRNPTWADDVVSETMVAALEAKESFRGGAQSRTWLVGILKNKIIDHLRRSRREVAQQFGADGDEQVLDESVFDDAGRYREPLADWGDPEAVFGRAQFFAVLEACMTRLPQSQGRVFMMREWLELSTEEICQELQVTPSNVWMLLHRARLRLQECVNINWFESRK
jgi:RNA polymerase sigma-70 factor (ECF subfamily)